MTRDPPSEQRRYDGAPAPRRNAGVSIGDVKAAAAEARRNATCDHCGYDPDSYDELTTRSSTYIHDCPRHQSPNPKPVHLCADCDDEHDPEAEYVERFKQRDKPFGRYACGMVRPAQTPDPDMVDMGNGEMIEAPWSNPTPQVPVECDCGAVLETVLQADD